VTHADVRELIPCYAAGALEQEEAAIVQDHLEKCGFCSNLAREAAEVVHYLPYSADFRPAPAGALDRLMSAIGSGSAPLAQPEPELQPIEEAVRAAPARRLLERLSSWLTRPVFAPVAAAAVVLVGMAAWNFSLMGELREERRQMGTLQTRLGEQTHLLVMVTSSSTVARPLQGTALAPSAEVRLVMDPETNSAMLMAMRLPPLAPDRIYQVWLGRQGARMPAGRFAVDEQGDGECSLQLDGSVHSYDSAWITLEPAQGGPMPNSPGVARGVL